MQRSEQLARRFREVFLNGHWVANTNYQDQLSVLGYAQATTKIGTLNTIALLTFHINYYVKGLLNVFEGGKLEIKDMYSFDAPKLASDEDWKQLCNSLLENSEKFAAMVETMADEKLDAVFVNEKYGTFQRNIDGLIEHAYYHLGQITLVKKMLAEKKLEI